MKVLVTGGAGFIGSHVIDGLRGAGSDVVCIDSLDPSVHQGRPGYLRQDVDYCFADLRHWIPDSRFDDVDAIVHLAALGGVSRAAQEPANVIEANAVGTARLIEAARGWKNLRIVVLGSSFSVYGANYTYRCATCGDETNGSRLKRDLEVGHFDIICRRCGADAEILPINELARPDPLEAYGASKYMQELCFRGFASCSTSILRFSSVYGPRLRLNDGEATIIARLIGWIAAGQRPRLFEDGRQIRDWVFVSDVVSAIRAVLAGAEAPSVINVCSGVPTRLVEACEGIADALGVSCPPEIVGGYRSGDMRHCLGDPSSLRGLLGRKATTFKEGIKLTFNTQFEAAQIQGRREQTNTAIS
jgi:dTDP-L-rhamnose 4-epimerase